MMNTKKSKKGFSDLGSEDVDLTMFTITDLTLTKDKEANLVFMAIELKRKVVTELVTTYFPTILLLLITFTTIFFDKDLFGDAIAVNLTIMLVMTTIFTSKIEELPPTSDMKMIDIWLISCLVIPFLMVILRTTVECLNCSCAICEGKGVSKSKPDGERNMRGERNEILQVFVGTGAKVAPQQVVLIQLLLLEMCNSNTSKQGLTNDHERGNSTSMNQLDKVHEEYSCCRGSWRQIFIITGGISFYFFAGQL